MKKIFTFGLMTALLMAITGNILAEEVTLRFKKPNNLGNVQLYIYVWSNNGYITPQWPGIPVSTTDDDFFAYSFDNSGYSWINANINDGQGGSFSRDIKQNPQNNSMENNPNKEVQGGGLYIINSGAWNDIYAASNQTWPQCANYGSSDPVVTPQQPTETIYLGDTKNLTFGCNSWAQYDNNSGQYKLWLSYNNKQLTTTGNLSSSWATA
ncbi:MAG: starch-binding protein, partial [Dysgonamonadaceae bacterium]|nr:starch-binding protein [Dysgonamonadaceae bacterium]